MKELNREAKLKFPGLLLIDTPGHESFRNLRTRAELCGIAILVVDITCGLEQQTIESLDLLKMRDKELIVALNKVDQLKGWISYPNVSIQKAIDKQTWNVREQFRLRLDEIFADFKRQGLSTGVCYKIKNTEDDIHKIVPTSAICCGQGITDLLLVLVRKLQKRKMEKLTFTNEVKCTVLEVMHIEGHESIIDVVLVDGVLRERDQIVVCGKKGPIVTTIDAFLTPLPKQELRIKNIEHAIAGTGLYVVGSDDDRKRIIELSEEGMNSFIIDKSAVGVCVLASTLGTLEALIELLKSSAMNIPVHFVKIGAVNEKDVKKAGLMKKKEYATILALDVEVKPEVQKYADEAGVKILMGDVCRDLLKQLKAYNDNIKEEKKREAAGKAIFPCVLKIIPNCVCDKKDSIVRRVDVLEGTAKVGTPICFKENGDFLDIGRIASIEINDKTVDTAMEGQQVLITFDGTNPGAQQKMFERGSEVELFSHISRTSIDMLKAAYQDDLSLEEWNCLMSLKHRLNIQ